MKLILKINTLFFLIISSFAFSACNNADSAKRVSTDSTSTITAGVSHEEGHTYRCPMHLEVVGKEGDTCPKCGMKLEHNDEPVTAAGTFFMEFASSPATIEPNKEVTLSVTPKKKSDASAQVSLDITHEKKIHFILVSDDLSWFDHVHPEYTSSGAYDVKTTFPLAGKYYAFADYKPTNGGHVVDKISIDVKGNAPAAKTFSADKLSGTSGSYSFELVPDGGKLITETPLHISGILKKDGKQIDANSIDNYLGAKAHFVMISLIDKEYMHVHPDVADGKFDLHTTIDKPGLYRGWVQFNAGGKINTIDFTMNVGKAESVATTSETKKEHNH